MLKIYQTILSSLDENNIKKLINLYNKMLNSNTDYVSKYYDNFTDAKKESSKMMMDSVYRINDEEENTDEEENVKIFDLCGEPFYMMVHGSTEIITDFQNGQHDGLSMSFISGERLNVFNDGVIYGFDNLLPEQFVELYTKDTSTEFDMGDEQKSMLEAVPQYSTPERFIENTDVSQYNEVVYLAGKKKNKDLVPPKPSYIVCIDRVNEKSITAAKEIGIPIVRINTAYYPKIEKNNMGHFAFLDETDTYKTL